MAIEAPYGHCASISEINSWRPFCVTWISQTEVNLRDGEYSLYGNLQLWTFWMKLLRTNVTECISMALIILILPRMEYEILWPKHATWKNIVKLIICSRCFSEKKRGFVFLFTLNINRKQRHSCDINSNVNRERITVAHLTINNTVAFSIFYKNNSSNHFPLWKHLTLRS